MSFRKKDIKNIEKVKKRKISDNIQQSTKQQKTEISLRGEVIYNKVDIRDVKKHMKRSIIQQTTTKNTNEISIRGKAKNNKTDDHEYIENDNIRQTTEQQTNETRRMLNYEQVHMVSWEEKLQPSEENITVTAIDVICGRGKTSSKHSGNKRFRQIVHSSVQKYAETETSFDKSMVIQSIIDFFRSTGTRFLKKNYALGKWTELSDNEIREKVGHAIRYTINSRGNKRNKEEMLSYTPEKKSTNKSTKKRRASPERQPSSSADMHMSHDIITPRSAITGRIVESQKDAVATNISIQPSAESTAERITHRNSWSSDAAAPMPVISTVAGLGTAPAAATAGSFPSPLPTMPHCQQHHQRQRQYIGNDDDFLAKIDTVLGPASSRDPADEFLEKGLPYYRRK